MKRIIILLFLSVAAVQLHAQISDKQVVDMLQQMQQQGLSQQQIMTRLSQSGVTREQITHVREQVEQQARAASRATGRDAAADPRNVADNSRLLQSTIESDSLRIATQRLVRPESNIFGHSIFSNENLTFEPSLNIATPDSYVLGPGDEVIVDVWGDSQQTVRQTISPDGSIVADRLGPVYLNGLTVAEAGERLRKSFARIYSGVDGGETFVKLSLGRIRSIRINVMGEVVAPGTYTVPSLATLFHVLYNAGGVNEIGSLRAVKINRAGKQIASVDIYSYLLEGRSDLDIALNDGDAVVVPPYTNLVWIAGKVKRPMIYELKEGETLSSLLDYSGGFTGDAYTASTRVIRKSGREYEVFNVNNADFSSFGLTDKDSVTVDAVLARFANSVEITGAVFRPGLYAVGGEVSTVKQLIEKAEGLMGDAFANRAVLYRVKPDYTVEVVSINIGALMAGEIQDIALQNDDILDIPSIFDLREDYTVTVSGDVGVPGTYSFAENMSLEDLVVRAGGLLESASTVRVDVSRRIKDPKSMAESLSKARIFSFNLTDGLAGSEEDFVLEPFDVVYIRSSPGYSVQQNVSVNGEVLFGGEYALAAKNERLSGLVARAGGLTSEAYVEGARLIRRMNDEESERVQSSIMLTRRNGTDSLSMEDLNIKAEYLVGINLDRALAEPGSDYDLVLREGDRLEVPEYVSTVKISGGVTYPNTVAYNKKSSLKDYIRQGGGFAPRAYRNRVYVVHMNGTVAKARMLSGAQPSPGSEIIVPLKSQRNNMSMAEILGMASSTTSIAAMVTSILNMSK